MLGRYDQQVSAILAAQYFNSLEAPQKKLIWFEKSGHAPPFEESDKFNAEIKQIGYELGLLTSE
jgi:pimeloyl-ACP methyl ester carboxylesterase